MAPPRGRWPGAGGAAMLPQSRADSALSRRGVRGRRGARTRRRLPGHCRRRGTAAQAATGPPCQSAQWPSPSDSIMMARAGPRAVRPLPGPQPGVCLWRRSMALCKRHSQPVCATVWPCDNFTQLHRLHCNTATLRRLHVGVSAPCLRR
jgi:hypothetical protein